MGGIVTTCCWASWHGRSTRRLAVYDCRFVLDYYRPTADGRLLSGGGAITRAGDLRIAELRPCRSAPSRA